MSDPNGLVLHEVFGSDLDSGEEKELRSRITAPALPAAHPAPATLRPPPVMPDSDSDDDAPAPPPPAPRRPIQFSDSDDDDERPRLPAPRDPDLHAARRRRKRKRAAAHPDPGPDSDDRPPARIPKRAPALEPDPGEVDDPDDVVKTEGSWHVSDDIEAKTDDDHEDDRDDDDSADARPKKPLNAVEEAILHNKARRRPRNRELDPKKVEADCIAFLERMMKARDDDVKAYRSGSPALNKLKMLRDVELMAMKVSHREQLLDNMLLAIIKAWLDPMPDGALPNLQIRTSLLQILLDIPVDSEWVERLQSSQGLGKLIHFLSIKDDHPANRRLAEKLMKRWARPVYQSNNNFHDLLDEFDRPEEGRRAPKDGVAAERKAARETVRNFQTAQERIRSFKHKTNDEQILATVPRRAPFLFTALAEGSASIDEKAIREMKSAKARNKKVNRTMSTLRKANRNRAARAAKPSLNGRG